MSGRSRGYSLRTQLFNKKLEDKLRSDSEGIEMEDASGVGGESVRTPSYNPDDALGEVLTKRKTLSLGTKIMDLILNRTTHLSSDNGRIIPICLDKDSVLYQKYAHHNQLIDERTGKAYCSNLITSSRYTLYSFLPRQLYAQFSKLANAYFLVVAILQMIPSWSTTGTYTTIVPLMIFLSISMAREAWDDFKRHKLDKEENNKTTKVFTMGKDTQDRGNASLYSLSNVSTRSTDAILSDFNSTHNLNDVSEPSYTDHFTNLNLLRSQFDIHVKKKEWKNLKVGDFVLLNSDDWVPADILLLSTDGENNEAFVETMALDGETNLKNKSPLPELSKRMTSATGLSMHNAVATLEDPNNDLYNFEGTVNIDDKLYPLGSDNVIYRGSIIRNTQNVVGIVIFSGEETKIRMNAIKNPRTKAPKLQSKINFIVLFMVFVVASMAMFSFLGQRIIKTNYVDNNKAWYLLQVDAGTAPTIMSFIIMYNTLIPLSLYVTTEIIKAMQSKLMEWDIDMYHVESDTPCESRTATILEELGQVSYIFSDKTGTLTDNKMIFRKFSICGSSWLHQIDDDLAETTGGDIEVISIEDRSFLNNFDLQSTRSKSVRTSIEYKGISTAKYTGRPSIASQIQRQELADDIGRSETNESADIKDTKGLKTSVDLLLYIQKHPNTIFSIKAKFFILSLALCHTCLPKRSYDADDSIVYQSSSPDELALVTAARDMGYVVTNRNASTLSITTYPNGFENQPVIEDYEVLENINFDSQRKRMSVAVKMPNDPNRVLLICKGADNVILERLRNAGLAQNKILQQQSLVDQRKLEEAEMILHQRKSREHAAARDSISGVPRNSQSQNRSSLSTLKLDAVRKSISRKGTIRSEHELQIDSIDDFLSSIEQDESQIENIMLNARKSIQMQQKEKYGDLQSQFPLADSTESYIGDQNLIDNEEYILEKTLNAIDEFSTEGLRTLLYSYRWIPVEEYEAWESKYHDAKTSLIDRAKQIAEVGGQIEVDLQLLGATAIEDKLQEGVPEAIQKIKRAGIKMWMLTGDKRETAINIGYACRLIYDYSTVVILRQNDQNLISKMTALGEEICAGKIAHCVLVVDGASLAIFENNPTMMSVFIELCTSTDSVICCRASPSQKALIVTNIRLKNKELVTLAIGDGANDIAMIQSADIGVGITGKEGLQASRSSDYSIAQFRYLLKLLFVHGRYNYVRTSKFVLCTFYKEVLFYLTQMIYQRQTMFSGTSLYEPWSLSMFNTLFTSLPVICIGMFEKDLKPMTLLAVPELYTMGQKCQAFNLKIFLFWMFTAAGISVLITFLNFEIWGFTAQSDNSIYPIGVINFTAICFLINVKCQLIETRNRNWLAFASLLISCIGWIAWCCLLPGIYGENAIYDVLVGLYHHFGRDITWWGSSLILIVFPMMIDIVCQTFRLMIWPTDADIFAELEQKDDIRKKLEFGAYNELHQSWTMQKDPSSIKRYARRAVNLNKNKGEDLAHDASDRYDIKDFNTDEYEMLPSGKLIRKKKVSNSSLKFKIGKKLRFKLGSEPDDFEVKQIIESRMKELE
ncbi:unnamed protein product [Kluyveromyces dobzhanskii CBS 2104]|uniref:Phospholipid-transporting ATPase n=1 Tax=Kluyveromyces dobzhanskii CBS 2104 TaxID=1427455 RepID=A0A0A8L7K4_9SACH|nr:unnamed protein product [Kluyveromyces dobzhanskii CBS 2104]